MKNKITFVFISFCILFFGISIRAFYIQVYENNHYLKKANKQTVKMTKLYPQRGGIYERNGFPLAINTKTYSIFTMPKEIQGKIPFKTLSKIVPELSFELLIKKIKKRTRYTWLARKIPLNKNQVEDIKKIKGIYIENVPKRIYPNHELLSQTIGFVGVDNTGLAGLEYYFDKELRGQSTIVKYFKDARGKLIRFRGVGREQKPVDLYLSIDKKIQAVAEDELKKAVIQYNALKGGIGVIDASNGEILAIANYPTFDPNTVQLFPANDRKLSFVTDPFEPGSTFKAVTMASALEHKIATPDTHYYCERGRFKVEGHYITEADRTKKLEWLPVSEIMKHSSNIGTTKIAFDLTFPRLKKTMEDFGIGKKTGIELPGESRGIFSKKNITSSLSLSNISFGQGVATTGIQMLSIFAAIANEGILMPPTLIKDKNKGIKGKRIISQKTANELIKMMLAVVEEGTGTNARIPHFKIAGKTSTAQRLKKGGGYSGYIPGFIGLPVSVKNRFVIYVYIEDPKGRNYYGNVVAAPVFRKVAQYILYKDKDFSSLALQGKSPQLYDSVKLKRASLLRFTKDTIPDFTGLDKISAAKLALRANVSLIHKGMGVVLSQSPKAGVLSQEKTIVELIYLPPSL